MSNQKLTDGERWDKVTIKRMEIEDVDEVLDIAATTMFNPWSKEMILEEIAHPFSHCFLLSQKTKSGGNLPLGFLCFRQIVDESELLNLSIGPEFRRKGFGKKLMSYYIDFGEEQGVKKYFLEVSVANIPAIHLYHSFGFRSLGKRKNFYQGRYDALLMTRSAS